MSTVSIRVVPESPEFREHLEQRIEKMSTRLIKEAIAALDGIDPMRIKSHEHSEKIAYRRAVLNGYGKAAHAMALAILNRPGASSAPVPRAPKRRR